MPKNQKLSATDEAILRMEPTAKEMKKRQLARQEATNKRLRKEIKESGKRNPVMEAFEAWTNYEDGGDVKRPGIGFKPMDMGGDILNSYLEGIGNSKETTVKGGGKKPKPVKKAQGGAVSPRKAQGMMYGGSVRKKK